MARNAGEAKHGGQGSNQFDSLKLREAGNRLLDQADHHSAAGYAVGDEGNPNSIAIFQRKVRVLERAQFKSPAQSLCLGIRHVMAIHDHFVAE